MMIVMIVMIMWAHMGPTYLDAHMRVCCLVVCFRETYAKRELSQPLLTAHTMAAAGLPALVGLARGEAGLRMQVGGVRKIYSSNFKVAKSLQ